MTYLGPMGSSKICKTKNYVIVATSLRGLNQGLVFTKKSRLDMS